MDDLKQERRLVTVLAGVQFVNVVDFMMVMPLGPFFAAELGMPVSEVGIVGAAYTIAAAVAGVAGVLVLDRFERRRALALALVGLAAGTALGGLATDVRFLILARAVAGAFGGPATSLAMAIVADTIPPQRRGRAMGAVMGAFAAASVLGVPVGLVLAESWSFRAPFIALGAVTLVVASAARALLPRLTAHMAPTAASQPPMAVGWARPMVLLAMLAVATNMGAAFSLVPNFPTYFVANRAFPESQISVLYLFGGIASFGAMRLSGRWVDKYGGGPVAWAGTVVLVCALAAGFLTPGPAVPVWAIFIPFMLSMSLRNVSCRTVTSRVPSNRERARFMSAQSVMQHVGSSVGAFGGAAILSTGADGMVVGFPELVLAAVAAMLVLPVSLFLIERQLTAAEAEGGARVEERPAAATR